MKQQGQILLIAVVFMAVVTSLIVSLVGYAGVQIKSHRQAVAREQGINIAEAGAELAIWKLNNQGGYAGESNTAYGAGTFTVTLTTLSSSSKLVKVDAYVPNSTSPKAHRTVQVTASTSGVSNIVFQYGVQVGASGIDMNNNATVTGDIYSNGSVTGSKFNTITGHVDAVGTVSTVTVTGYTNANAVTTATISGNTNVHTSLSGSTVNANVSAATISNCTITGTAAYNTRTSCSVSGATTTPNPSVPAAPSTISMPIPAAQITTWENEAAAGTLLNGNQTVSGNSSLGPGAVKVVGNLVVSGTLTLNGTTWVTGNVTVNNGATIQLASSYGSLTGVLIAGTNGNTTNGAVTIANNGHLQGSGSTGSYILVISELNSTTTTAIDISNNALSTILYAATGQISISNNAHVRNVSALKIHLGNNVALQSDSNITASYFSSSAGPWIFSRQTYQLLQ